MSDQNAGISQEQMYQQYQMLVNQMQLYESQEQSITGLITDLQRNMATLDGIGKHNDAGEFMIPINGLLMFRVQLVDIKEILVNLGADVMLPASFETAKEVVQKRLDEMVAVYNRLLSEKSRLEELISQMQAQLGQ